MNLLSAEDYLKAAKAYNYEVFFGDLNLNIVGLRETTDHVNEFNDLLAVYWQQHGSWNTIAWPITTLPGLPFLQHPENEKGCAILVAGQYLGAYQLGEYHGYPALKQVRPVRVYRDNLKNGTLVYDASTVETGLFGIDIHKGGLSDSVVEKDSAGCQVFQRAADFDQFIDLCAESTVKYGNRFSYTLLGYP